MLTIASLAAARTVSIDSGQLRGVSAEGIESYKNIPYAAAPIGQLRWRPPQPVAAWKDVRPADQWGAECMQQPFIADMAVSSQPMSEDCLTLNVWAPAQQEPRKSPVMVWIHGGGFTNGSASRELYDGTRLARLGAVVVTFNYRLGRFGFFAHPALTQAAQGEPTGNFAFMDQIAALQWVRRNIAAFGGDPNNVTVFGESAGGASVNVLMIAPQARGLFHRAIVQSGGGRDKYPKLHQPLPDGTASAEARGLAFAASVRSENTVEALRALPAQQIVAGLQMGQAQPETYSGPMLDGALLTKDISAAFALSEQQRVPYMIGTTDREAGVLNMNAAQADQTLKLFPDQARLFELFDPARTGNRVDVAVSAGTDWVFVEPARYLAQLASRSGQPTYLYRFSYVAAQFRGALPGAPHASDVPYVFDTWDKTVYRAAADDREIVQLIGAYWTAFAATGDPNGATRTSWPRYSADEDTLLEFDRTGGATARPHLHRERLDYFAALQALLKLAAPPAK